MDSAEQLRLLEEAHGDPVKLAMATVDIAFHRLSNVESSEIKDALEAAAIPHWCDETILACLLEISIDASTIRLARLRQLSVVEEFPARGRSAVDVHEATRLAIRARLIEHHPERFLTLTRRAFEHFAGRSDPHTRIESVFHRALVQPDAAADDIDAIYLEWFRQGRVAEQLALELMLDELRGVSGISPLPKAVAAHRLADIREERQSTEHTLRLAREALAVYRALGDDLRISRALSLIGGRLRAVGDNPAARGVFVEALEISRQSSGRPMPDIDRLRNLSICLDNLGSLDSVEGRTSEAFAACSESLELRRRIASLEPANPYWQRDLSISLSRLGQLYVTQGNGVDGRKSYLEALEIRRRLTALDPANTEWQRDLSVLLNRIGDLDTTEGRADKAREFVTESLSIRRRLAALDPANTEWRRDVSLSLDRLGVLDMKEGHLQEARRSNFEALEIRRGLVASDHANSEWQCDLALSLNRLGDLETARGEIGRAREMHAEALGIRRRLAALDPANTEWQRDLSVSLYHLGDWERAQGHPDAARLGYAEGLEISLRLAALHGTNVEWQSDLFAAYTRMASISGVLAERLRFLGEALVVIERLVLANPKNVRWRQDRDWLRARLVDSE